MSAAVSVGALDAEPKIDCHVHVFDPARFTYAHCGRPHPLRGVGQPGFQALLAFADTGRACVKLASLVKLSSQAHPYRDARSSGKRRAGCSAVARADR